mgnify:CR=1 FL=1
MTDLYYIENIACDGETSCLAHIPPNAINLFRDIVNGLNHHANFDENPGISIYKIDESFVRIATEEDPNSERICDENGKEYIFIKNIREVEHYGYKNQLYRYKLSKGVKKIC